MRNLVLSGLQAGVLTTNYPAAPDLSAGVSPGRPVGRALPVLDRMKSGDDPNDVLDRCPTHAIAVADAEFVVDYRRCVHCFRCVRDTDSPLGWEETYEWAGRDVMSAREELGRAFGRSLHIRVLDAGDCGACLNEVRQLNSPYYNMHRLGFFVTPTPRDADVLLVTGPVTDQLREPLRKAYAAMPDPKRVLAIGACAASGGVFGPSFMAGTGAAQDVPVDIVVPGCPPPPLAILHGLLVLTRRKPPVSLQRAVTSVP
jgi:Ni,Fe-hydrogenase III small subunit